jgi:hypothetical protein
MPASLANPGEERFKVKCFECPFRTDFGSLVGNGETVVEEEDISFDAAESVVQCVQERTRMEVIIMGMGVLQGEYLGGGGLD